MGGTDDFDDPLENAHAGLGTTEHPAVVSRHRVVVQVLYHSFVGLSFTWVEIHRFERKYPPTVPMLENFGPRLRVAVPDVGRIHHEDILRFH